MNTRERTLLVALLGVVGVGGFLLASYVWFVRPLEQHKKRIASMAAENRKRQAEIDEFKADQKRLALARLKSLPLNKNEAGTEYNLYLHTLFAESGINKVEITRTEPVDVKPVATFPNVKKVGHQVMTFTVVKAKCTLSQLVNILEGLRTTPYEHHVKNLSVARGDSSPKDPNVVLVVDMTIETLLVARTESKPGVPPGVDVKMIFADSLTAHLGVPAGLGQMLNTVVLTHAVPTEGERNYADIAKRNIFVGMVPTPKDPPPVAKVEKVTPPPPPPRPPGQIPAFIRLTQINVSAAEAHYLNLFYKKDERMISAKAESGHNTFLVEADDSSYVFFLAKVLKVDNRAVFIQIKDKVHQWNIGDTLEFATTTALSDLYMQGIELEPDFEWGKKELEKEKNKPQQVRKKGPMKKGS